MGNEVSSFNGISDADLAELKIYMSMLDLFRCQDVTHQEAKDRIKRSTEQARLARLDEIRCRRLYADVQSA